MEVLFNGRIEEVTYASEHEMQFIVRIDTHTALLCRLSHRLMEHKEQLTVGNSFQFKGKAYLEDTLTGNNRRALNNKITIIDVQ